MPYTESEFTNLYDPQKLFAIYQALTGGGGTQRTTALSAVTGSGASPVAAGKRSVTFIFSSDFVGTIKTVAIDASQITSLSFEAPPGDTLDAIAYTVTAGTLTILTVT